MQRFVDVTSNERNKRKMAPKSTGNLEDFLPKICYICLAYSLDCNRNVRPFHPGIRNSDDDALSAGMCEWQANNEDAIFNVIFATFDKFLMAKICDISALFELKLSCFQQAIQAL